MPSQKSARSKKEAAREVKPPAPFRLYDTLTRETHPLAPADGQTFRFYCCGPTVYGPAHIGNFRTFILVDVFRRVMETLPWPVRHVQNITNVEDKTIRQSQAEGKSLADFTSGWTEKFHADSEALHILPPTSEPDAVSSIPQQIALIEKLVEKKHAYAADDGSVYYDVSSFEKYGRLSNLENREVLAGAGDRSELAEQSASNHPTLDDEYDRESAADFALWKAYRKEDGPNAWDSPWGRGRPGWHIECSAMCLHELGESFDLHAGGIDLIFPHHENEIAQSEAVTGKKFAGHWYHIAHLRVEGNKMSKSLGNDYRLDDIREKGFTPLELRYVLLSGHYRQPLNFTWHALNDARKATQRLSRLAIALREKAGPKLPKSIRADQAPGPELDYGPFQAAREAMLDDLKTPEALGQTFTAARELERALAGNNLSAKDATSALRGLCGVLWMLGFPEKIELPKTEAPQEILDKAAQRWEAKKQKDFATADRLRDEVQNAGWIIKDAKDDYRVIKAGEDA